MKKIPTPRCGNAFAYSELIGGEHEAAVLIAANYREAAEALLRATIDGAAGRRSPRMWLMLLELLCLSDRRAEFEALALRYRGAFNTSAPRWERPAPINTAGTLALKGVLGAASGEFEQKAAQLAAGRKSLVVDMSEVERIEYTYLHTLQVMLSRLAASGTRVILANVSEVSATLLQAVGADRHAVLMRRKGLVAEPMVELALAA